VIHAAPIAPQAIVAAVKELPTLSQVTVRLAALLRDPRTSAQDLERVIRVDPALTANLLRVANAAYFGLRCRAESVRQAVTLLGVRRIYDIAAAAALAPVIPPRIPGYEIDAPVFWVHSVAVGVLAERLARELDIAPPDLTFTAGLLHDIGKLAIATFVGGASRAILAHVRRGEAFAAAERTVLGLDHGEVAALVAEAWSLPPAIGAAARWHHAPEAVARGEHGPLVDLVHAADGLAHAMGLGADAGELARTIEAGVEERLGIRARRLERVAGESLDEIREMASAYAPAAGGTR
jgi:putative nucleotidyltransferase with HDIG domain